MALGESVALLSIWLPWKEARIRQVVRREVGGSMLIPSALKSFPDFLALAIALAIFSPGSIGARFILIPNL